MAANKTNPDKWPEIKENLICVTGWCREGATNEMIAERLKIGLSTFYKIKSKHVELRDALKEGKEVIDFMVENALLKSAMGFEYIEEAVTNKGDVVEVRKTQAPSNTAQIFWLKNRKSKQWKDKHELEVQDGTAELTEEQIEARLKELKGK